MIGLALLLPFETRTLPGWPAAEDPAGIHSLGLLLGVPAIIILVIVALVTASKLAAGNRATTSGVRAEPIEVDTATPKQALTAGHEGGH